MQNNKLFVGNVAYATQIQTLLDLFSQYGTITDSFKPAEKGYAFITFSTDEEAAAAMEALNGKEVDGREINVSIAKPREERPNGGFRPNGGGNRNFRDGGRGNSRGGGFDRGRRDRY